MFQGQYEHSIDTKGRTIVPIKYREELGETFFVTLGLDKCLYMYSAEAWEEFCKKLGGLSSSVKNRKLQRHFVANSMEVSVDKQGRVLIPIMLRKLVGLEKDIVFVGMINRVEIWDSSLLQQVYAEDDPEDIATALDDLDFSL